MPRNDEFELVLGNKQLLSVFFIVVVLLGVFFTMGYIVGRNTAEVQVASAPSKPLVVEAGSGPAATPSPKPSSPPKTTAQVTPPPTPVKTPPAKSTPPPRALPDPTSRPTV